MAGAFIVKPADRSKKLEFKKLFNSLASEEAEHKKTFEEFLSRVILYEPTEGYPGEYLAYLQNSIDGKIFVTPDNKSTLSEF